MLVSDRSGMGKTDLLRKLRLLCERDHGVAVALVLLDEFVGRQDEFTVVDHLHSALTSTGASFPRFAALNGALRRRDVTPFGDRFGGRVSAALDLRQAAIAGNARVSGVAIDADNVTIAPQMWTDELDAYVRGRCVEAFLEELETYARERPVALLFDGLEKVSDALRRWIIVDIVRQRLLDDWQNRKMVVVLAGVDVADMILGRLPTGLHDCVEPVPSFSEWSREQVGEFLAANDLDQLEDTEVIAIHSLLSAKRYTLASLLLVASMMAQQRRSA
jgi:hypothetical protein